MTVRDAIHIFQVSQKNIHRKRTKDSYRYSGTYASRNGIPMEVISKVFLRHQDIKITQMYLGKITDTEAIRWMDVLHGN